MAVRGRPLDVKTLRLILALRSALSIRRTARAAAVSPSTVQKYRKFSR